MTASKPNVIVLLTDDQGYGDLGCHGNPILKTPVLDKLHSESVRFTDFHAAPLCTPTRGQLMTGCDALHNGAFGTVSGREMISPDVPTMAEMFARNGYRTGLFGKWHLGETAPSRPSDRGFEESVNHLGGAVGVISDYWNNDYFDDYYVHNDTVEQFPGYCQDVWFREGISWMKQCHKQNEPFFLYLASNGDHIPLFVPEQYREPYLHLGVAIASFYGMIANFDENLGVMEEELEAMGLRENTIVIFMSDNGGTIAVDYFNAGMRGKKATLWEGGHRVPCFVRWPAGSLLGPRDINQNTQIQDILPTLMDLCSMSAPETGIDGMSLSEVLTVDGAVLEDRMLVVQSSNIRAEMGVPGESLLPLKWDSTVMWGNLRLVFGKELYDVSLDPAQTMDMSEGHPEVVREMRAYYEKWWSELSLGDPPRYVIGSDDQNPVCLTGNGWEGDHLQWSQRSIRVGRRGNGIWHLKVLEKGRYTFSLARWPQEAGGSLRSGMEEYLPHDTIYLDRLKYLNSNFGVYPEGIELPIAKAGISVGAYAETKDVDPNDEEASFEVDLESGFMDLKSTFFDDAGNEFCGAYYVYIHKH